MFSFIFTSMIALSAAGASVDDLVLDLNAPLGGVNVVSASEIHQDLDFLKNALTKAYAGPNILRQIDAVLATEMGSQNLCDRLAAVLGQVRDAHLRASLDFRVCGTRPPAGAVGGNVSPDTWRVNEVNGVSVLAVPTFWPRFDARWNGFLEAVRGLRVRGRPFVIDLRGNTGGDDAMGFEMARVLLGMPDMVNLPTPVRERHFRQTPEAFAVQANNWAYQIMKTKAGGQTAPVYMSQRRDEILSWMERAKRGEFPDRYVEPSPVPSWDRSRVFGEKVLVLIDRMCASACETTLQVLENLPRRTLVGENTFGAVEYGELGRVVLPHSRVMITLSTMRVLFRDGRRVEKIGYPPNIHVPAGHDALTRALREL